MVKLLKDKKAVSPVIATLLMVAVTVVAALLVYGWVMGFTSTTVTQTGKNIRIEAATLKSDGSVTVYVRNTGTVELSLGGTDTTYNVGVYVGGVAISNPSVTESGNDHTLSPGELMKIEGSVTDGLQPGVTYLVRVSLPDGTYSEGPYTATS